jgi:hypothetical protein
MLMTTIPKTRLLCVAEFFLAIYSLRLLKFKYDVFRRELLMVYGYLTSSKMLRSAGEAKTTESCGHVAPWSRPRRFTALYLLKLSIVIT